MDKTEILERVKKVNEELLGSGLSLTEIDKFWEDCILIAKENTGKHIDGFKNSINAAKIAKQINSKFNLNLQPKIKRYINYETGVRFLMKNENNEIFYFKAIVLDFLCPHVEIELIDKTLIIK